MSKVAILGAGAIGGLAGVYMALHGKDVLFIDKNVDHVKAIREKGIRVDGCRGDFWVGPQRAVTPDELDENLEMVFIACKSQHTVDAVKSVMGHLTEDSVIVSLQNGMNEPEIAALVGEKRTMGALPDYGGAYIDPGHFEYVHEGPVYVGELNGAMTERALEAGELLGYNTRSFVYDNIMGRVWAKQVYSSQIAVSALVDAPVHEVLGCERGQKAAGTCVREALAVADAYGVVLPEKGDFFEPELYRIKSHEDTLRMMAKMTEAVSILDAQEEIEKKGKHKFVKKASGVHWDIKYRHRKSETSHLTGRLVEDGKKIGCAVPLNEKVVSMIYEIEDGKREMGWHNIEELEALIRELGVELP